MTIKKRKINGSNSSRYSSANHAQFQRTMHTKVGTIPLTITHITQELMDEWAKNIKLEIEINQAAAASKSTKKMIEFDKDRGITLSFIFKSIDAAKNSPVKAQRDAADDIRYVTDPYRGIQRKPYETESLLINGLLNDLDKPENKALIQALNLTGAVVQLTEQNELFESYRLQVADQKVSEALENSREVRPRTNANYQQVCDLIYGSYMLATEAADITKLETLIDEMNQIIADFKTLDTQTSRSATELTVRGTTKAVTITNLPQGATYKVIDIAGKTVVEGTSPGEKITAAVPYGLYTVVCDSIEWPEQVKVG